LPPIFIDSEQSAIQMKCSGRLASRAPGRSLIAPPVRFGLRIITGRDDERRRQGDAVMFRRSTNRAPLAPSTNQTIDATDASVQEGPTAPSAVVPSLGMRVALPELDTFGTVGATLGQGGQGAVFRLAVDGCDADLALKWYFPRTASAKQEGVLQQLLDRGAPAEGFLWPISMARPCDPAELGGFGYAMALRPDGYFGLVDFVAGRVDVSFRILTTIGLALADNFLALHNEGLCYRDISFGNVLFEAATGRVLICDNDNVVVDGVGPSTVRGTPYFMAPEVVRGDAYPSRNTDLWSLAVLLFYLFMVHHPLEGRRALEFDCWDQHAMNDLFGARPVFVFDPVDTSNAPEPGVHDTVLTYWPLYPQFVRDLFVQAFTVGIHDANSRVRVGVWRAAMARLRDSIAYCPRCGRQNFYDPAAVAPTCWSCGRALDLPPRLRIGSRELVLNHDTRVLAHHLRRDYDFSTLVASVVQHPANPSMWGLRNETAISWTVVAPGYPPQEVHPGRSATILNGLEIDFGEAKATIES
jgi:hypothetical protein